MIKILKGLLVLLFALSGNTLLGIPKLPKVDFTVLPGGRAMRPWAQNSPARVWHLPEIFPKYFTYQKNAAKFPNKTTLREVANFLKKENLQKVTMEDIQLLTREIGKGTFTKVNTPVAKTIAETISKQTPAILPPLGTAISALHKQLPPSYMIPPVTFPNKMPAELVFPNPTTNIPFPVPSVESTQSVAEVSRKIPKTLWALGAIALAAGSYYGWNKYKQWKKEQAFARLKKLEEKAIAELAEIEAMDRMLDEQAAISHAEFVKAEARKNRKKAIIAALIAAGAGGASYSYSINIEGLLRLFEGLWSGIRGGGAREGEEVEETLSLDGSDSDTSSDEEEEEVWQELPSPQLEEGTDSESDGDSVSDTSSDDDSTSEEEEEEVRPALGLGQELPSPQLEEDTDSESDGDSVGILEQRRQQRTTEYDALIEIWRAQKASTDRLTGSSPVKKHQKHSFGNPDWIQTVIEANAEKIGEIRPKVLKKVQRLGANQRRLIRKKGRSQASREFQWPVDVSALERNTTSYDTNADFRALTEDYRKALNTRDTSLYSTRTVSDPHREEVDRLENALITYGQNRD
ncbi:hypothetical protein HOM50_04975 [bacterium]|jgi:hypothetical protein|nr:hypothetical protein [bacterium]MBT5015734.1 hypothetical protein [bacterium]